MLILVAVTVKTVIDSGLFKHASASVGGYSESQAMEVLGTTLAGALAEKYTNANYNENEFLDEYIRDNLPGSQIAGDVVLVDGWAFELDRTVPEIVNDLGKGNPEDFKSPELTVTKGTLGEDKLSIPLNITALEATNGISKIEVYKYGEKTPLETFTCSNETTAVNKTFTATENAKYKVVAYSKLRATKIVEVTEIVPPSPTAADAYVRYTPDTAGNYTVPTTSGYSAQSIPQDTTLKWKVLSINSDGTIDLIADKPIATSVRFQGALGYNNGVYLLNDLCKSQYSNASLGATARSIDLVDIEKHFNDAGRAARDACTPSGIKYGGTKTYSGTYSYAPDVWLKHDKNVSKASNNIAEMESDNYYTTPISADTPTQSGSITVTQTGYSITSQASYYDDPNFHTLIFGTGTNYWLASRYAFCNSTYAYFGLRAVSGTFFHWYYLFFSDGSTNNSFYAVRPVVSLGSNFKLQQVTGTNEWEIVRK